MITPHDIDVHTIEIQGINHADQPDYSDAYIHSVNRKCGKPLNDEELTHLHDHFGSFVHETVFESIHG